MSKISVDECSNKNPICTVIYNKILNLYIIHEMNISAKIKNTISTNLFSITMHHITTQLICLFLPIIYICQIFAIMQS